MEWIKFSVVTLLTIFGLISLILSMYGTYKYDYVLNRMQAGAIGDTLGISLCLVALTIYFGFTLTTLKLILVIVVLWMSSPVASHLISRLEVQTNEKIEEECEVKDL
ncbi:MAG: monovalent cation/H(+) antiporter subunit G [Clostridia bacterium]